ncbi:MAG: hypothetical protein HRT57_15980 [Crocinitomicaceae bacterium]|nr:hypothetical protein [Crocinitomicaceae bacterium]
MKTITTVLTVCLLSTMSFATELNYSWQTGKYYHFDCSATDNVATSAMGMTMNIAGMKITSDSYMIMKYLP